jgi:microcystin-dependent protein
MAEPFVGEIRMFGGNFAPVDWALCNGQLMAISQNEALYTLIGTTYGGDGVQTFGLPDLQGRIPIHQGPGFIMGQKSGEETVTLNIQQIPTHSHAPQANTSATGNDPTNSVVAGVATAPPSWFATGAPSLNLASNFLGTTGGSQPHDNMMPYLVVNFIIALFGVFPSQN